MEGFIYKLVQLAIPVNLIKNLDNNISKSFGTRVNKLLDKPLNISRTYFLHIFCSTAFFFSTSTVDGFQNQGLEAIGNSKPSPQSQQLEVQPGPVKEFANPSPSLQASELAQPIQAQLQQLEVQPGPVKEFANPSPSLQASELAQPIQAQLQQLEVQPGPVKEFANPSPSLQASELAQPIQAQLQQLEVQPGPVKEFANPSPSLQASELAQPIQAQLQQLEVQPGPVKEFANPSPFVLRPMPIGNQLIALRSVSPQRNPFTSIDFNEITGQRNLPDSISLTGILKVGDSVVAMIKTATGEEIFEIGQQIGNGYKIESIVHGNRQITLSNGNNQYILGMNQ